MLGRVAEHADQHELHGIGLEGVGEGDGLAALGHREHRGAPRFILVLGAVGEGRPDVIVDVRVLRDGQVHAHRDAPEGVAGVLASGQDGERLQRHRLAVQHIAGIEAEAARGHVAVKRLLHHHVRHLAGVDEGHRAAGVGARPTGLPSCRVACDRELRGLREPVHRRRIVLRGIVRLGHRDGETAEGACAPI